MSQAKFRFELPTEKSYRVCIRQDNTNNEISFDSSFSLFSSHLARNVYEIMRWVENAIGKISLRG